MTFFYLILFCSFSLIFCGEIKNQIYYEFPAKSVSYCVRRLNKTSSIGCSSKSVGNIGLIEVAFNQSHIIKKLSQINSDTIFVLSSNLFIQKNVTDKLLLNKYVQGLIVLESKFCNESICIENDHESFSEDYKLPNSKFSQHNINVFNLHGNEFAFRNWPFPIVYLNERYIEEHIKLVSCYIKFNENLTSTRRCAIKIQNFMAAVKSFETSMAYQTVQDRFAGMLNPFQFYTDFTGMNYVVHSKETVQRRDNNSVIVLMARMDSLSMFERSGVSANGAITSTSLLLSVMKLLMSQPEFKTGQNLTKDVLFALLDNESYDYLGSNRFIIDLKSKQISKSSNVPVNMSHLDLLLEFGELAYLNFSDVNLFYQQTNTTAEISNKTSSYLKNLNDEFIKFGFRRSSSIGKFDLPPSSPKYFLNKRSISSIVLADHTKTFLNPFYNSFLDKVPRKDNSEELLAIANSVASFVFKESTGKNLTQFVSASDEYAPHKIVDCFANNLMCNLLQKVLPVATLSKLHSLGAPIPTQAHSSNKAIPQDYRLSYIVLNLLVYLSGQPVDSSACVCSTCSNFSWIEPSNGTKQCYKTRLDESDEFSYISAQGPIWVTSTIVDGQSLTMFVVDSNLPLLVTGSAITFVTVVVMAILSPNIGLLFSAQNSFNNVIC